MEDIEYKTSITTRGLLLLGELVAAASSTGQMPVLQFSRVKFGEGTLAEGENPETLDDVIAYVADGTSTKPMVEPSYNEDGSVEQVTVSFVVEYASHKNGADEIDRPFSLSEFAVMTFDLDTGEEFAFLRGDLVNCPMLITPFCRGALDIRQFQVSIVITRELEVCISFVPLNWLSAQDMYDYVEHYDGTVIQPWTDGRIERHNVDPESHDLANRFQSLRNMIDKIMEMFNGQGSAPFYWDTGIENGWEIEKGVINLAEGRVEC